MIKFSHLIYYDKIFSLMILSNKFLYRLKKSNKMQQYADIHHHHKHPGLGHLTRSVSRVTPALSIASLVSQLFSFLVGCRGMISRGFGFVAFFVCVRARILIYILKNQLFVLKYTFKKHLLIKIISTPTCFGLIRPSSGSCHA